MDQDDICHLLFSSSVSGSALSAFHVLAKLTLTATYMPMFQKGRDEAPERFREIAQGHKASERQSRNLNPGRGAPKTMLGSVSSDTIDDAVW